MRATRFLTLILMLVLVIGCSKGGKSPVTGNLSDESGDKSHLDSIPIIASDDSSAIGMMGAYNLIINPDTVDVELTPMRVSSLGESYIVSGTPYFTNTQCLKIKSIALDAGSRIHVVFKIKHPFEKGDTQEPPTAKNRLDLDLFDVAMLIYPVNLQPESYELTEVFTNVILNGDGYTKELEEVINETAALPFKNCYENSNNNRFEMGTDWQEFDVLFAKQSDSMFFELYITMGYGWSAVKKERLNPVYYVPEFNRKAAWKLKIDTQSWLVGNTDEREVTIHIYDWNHGSTVASSYPDPAHTNYIKSESDVLSVYVEISSMINSTVQATTEDTIYNGWDNPISYKAMIANENNLLEGAYPGLVMVTDSRVPSGVPNTADSLVHMPDMDSMEYYTIPEFVTYQSFLARVTKPGPKYGWGGQWGDTGQDVGLDVKCTGDNIYVTGTFYGLVDFDPGRGEEWFESGAEADIFVLNLDSEGRYQWAKTIGGDLWDEGHALDYNNGSIFVTGYFQGANVDFDPGPGVFPLTSNGNGDVFLLKLDGQTGDFQAAKSWGGGIWDEGHGLSIDWYYDMIYVVGYFQGENVDFDPGGGYFPLSSYSAPTVLRKNSFISQFDQDLNFVWAGMWGAGQDANWDQANDVSAASWHDILITGGFSGRAEFDPSPGWGADIQSAGGMDLYITSLDHNNNWQWTRSIGSSGNDEGQGVIAVYSGYSWVAVTGYFENSADFGNGDIHDSNGGRDALLAQWNPSGNYNWGRSWGAGIWDEGHALAYENGIHVTGYFQETVDFDPGVTVDEQTSNGGRDIFLVSYETNGTYIPESSYTWGGMGIWDEGFGVDTGSMYITGAFELGMDFDPGPDEDYHSSNGNTDIFLIKIRDEECIDETEPNNTCDFADAATYMEGEWDCGSVTHDVDDVDWWYIETYNPMYGIEVVLENLSEGNIDVYIYDENCQSEEASSLNPGYDDEYILWSGAQNLTIYKVKVVSVDDGLPDTKNYLLDVYERQG